MQMQSLPAQQPQPPHQPQPQPQSQPQLQLDEDLVVDYSDDDDEEPGSEEEPEGEEEGDDDMMEGAEDDWSLVPGSDLGGQSDWEMAAALDDNDGMPSEGIPRGHRAVTA